MDVGSDRRELAATTSLLEAGSVSPADPYWPLQVGGRGSVIGRSQWWVQRRLPISHEESRH